MVAKNCGSLATMSTSENVSKKVERSYMGAEGQGHHLQPHLVHPDHRQRVQPIKQTVPPLCPQERVHSLPVGGRHPQQEAFAKKNGIMLRRLEGSCSLVLGAPQKFKIY